MIHFFTLFVFVLAYVLFVVLPGKRALTACAGAAVLVIGGAVPWHNALFEHINWNVIALFFGTLILAELFMQSRMPAVMAEALVRHTRTLWGAMMGLCLLASFLSMFLENVAVVLLVAPVALSLAEQAGVRPTRLLFLIAMFSNLQGTATLIGDPPSMILAGYMRMTFNDFFFYHGRPGLFFAVQAGALAAFAVAGWLLRKYRRPVEKANVEKPRALTPTFLLIALVIGLSLSSLFDREFKWLAGTWTLALAAVGLLWYRLGPRWTKVRHVIRLLDWPTTFFLMGVFVLVGGLADSLWLDRLASAMSVWVGHSRSSAFFLLVGVSMLISGFVDNVPFLLAMIPVAKTVAQNMGTPPEFLLFGLLIGTCLGGNITPIGASANIVTVGILRKRGDPVGFGAFLRVGMPFTLAAVAASAAFLWIFWSR